MADGKKDAFDELGLESGAFEALERDFQQVRARVVTAARVLSKLHHSGVFQQFQPRT